MSAGISCLAMGTPFDLDDEVPLVCMEEANTRQMTWKPYSSVEQ